MLANAYGLQYQLPESRDFRGAPPSNPQMDTAYGDENLLDSDLYVKEGVTDEYYKSVAALKSYANEMSSRYGYDVTKPNYRDPESIKAHKLYLESLAALQMKRNELKRLGQQENLSLQSPNIQMRTDQATGRDFAVNTGENDMVKGLRETAKNIATEEEADVFLNQVKPMVIEQLEEELSSSQDPREREELKASLQMIQNIRPDVGLTPYQKAQIEDNKALRGEQSRHNRAMEARAGSGGGKLTQGQSDALSRIKVMDDFTKDEATLSRNLGMERVESAAGTFFRKKGEKDTSKWVPADPNDPAAFFMKLNEVINRDGGAGTVGIDRIYSLQEMGGFEVGEIAQSLLARVDAKAPIMDGFLENFNKTAEAAVKAKSSGKDNITPTIMNMLEDGKEIPDNIANKIGSSLEDKKIRTIKQETSGWFGTGSPLIVITVPGKTSKSPDKTIKLSMDNQEDVDVLREILNFNKERIPRSLVESLSGAIQPQRGTEIAREQIIDDF